MYFLLYTIDVAGVLFIDFAQKEKGANDKKSLWDRAACVRLHSLVHKFGF